MATKTATIVSAPLTTSNYARYVNPQWVALLNLLDMNVEYDRCIGCELFTKDGRRILDYLSGYCVHNAGHNHPEIIQAVTEEIAKRGPAMSGRAMSRKSRENWRNGSANWPAAGLRKFILERVEAKEWRRRSSLHALPRPGREFSMPGIAFMA